MPRSRTTVTRFPTLCGAQRHARRVGMTRGQEIQNPSFSPRDIWSTLEPMISRGTIHHWILAILAATIAWFLWLTGIIRPLDQSVSDLILSAPRPTPAIEVPFVAVVIDDVSVREGGPFPWPRTKTADLINVLVDQGSRAVVVDAILSEPGTLPAMITSRERWEECRRSWLRSSCPREDGSFLWRSSEEPPMPPTPRPRSGPMVWSVKSAPPSRPGTFPPCALDRGGTACRLAGGHYAGTVDPPGFQAWVPVNPDDQRPRSSAGRGKG